MKLRMLGLAAIVGLLLTGCTAVPLPSAPERIVPAPLPDRDAQTVLANVALLDPCALMDAAVTASIGQSGTENRQTYGCAVGNNDDVRLSVQLMASHVPYFRFNEDRLILGGAVAYRSSTLLDSSYCHISLPIDHTRAIVFTELADRTSPTDCATATRYAAAAAERLLADPASLRRPAANDALDVCGILVAANGPARAGMRYEPRISSGVQLGACGLWREVGPKEAVPAVAERSLDLGYGQPLDGILASPGWDPHPVIELAGQRVLVLDGGADESCRLIWDARPAVERDGVVISGTLTAQTCLEAKSIFPAVIEQLDAVPPLTATADPVLYADGASDLAVDGPCSDALNPIERECIAWEGESSQAENLIARGIGDPNLLCAATNDALQAAFDGRLEVVTVRERNRLACEYVTERHELSIQVWASDIPIGDEPGEIAGHAVWVDDQVDNQRTTCIDSHLPGDPGRLCVRVSVRADRAEGQYDGGFIDGSPTVAVEAMLTRVVPDLLGP